MLVSWAWDLPALELRSRDNCNRQRIVYHRGSVTPIQHPIQVAARLSGLSPHVIRVWERRYGAVKPARTKTNRRFYSDHEVQRLRMLAKATAAGHRIGAIARLGVEDLNRLVATVDLEMSLNISSGRNG